MNRYSKVAVGVTALALMVMMLSIGSVRSSLAEFLHIFRVEKVQTVTISQQDLAELQHAMETGDQALDIQSFGKINIAGKEEMKSVSLADVIKEVDFTVKTVSVEGYKDPSFRVQSAMKIDLMLDIEKVNAMITTLGSNKLLPEELDGKTFSVSIPAMVVAEYPAESEGDMPLMIGQARSPQIMVSGEVDVNKIRDALINLDVLPQNLRDKLTAINDWQHTLLVPNIEGSSKDVQVNGNDGVFISPGKSEVDSGVLIWPQDGVIIAIQGNITLDKALAIASLLK